MQYKFLGEPDKIFPSLEKGAIYVLSVETMTKGLFFKKAFPIIVSPFRCPYSNWEAFYKNWQPIK